MNSKLISIVVVGLLVIGGLVFWDTNSNNSTPNSNSANIETQSTQAEQEEPQTQDLPTYTLADVAEHNSGEDCWMAIDGKVYDVTKYLPLHPGGGEILRGCGTDATKLFTERTTDDGQKIGSGTPHSQNATNQLENYLIGVLGQ